MKYILIDSVFGIEVKDIFSTGSVNWQTKYKLLGCFDLILSIEGQHEVLCDDQLYILPPSTYFLAAPGQTIALRKSLDKDTESLAYMIHFNSPKYEVLKIPREQSGFLIQRVGDEALILPVYGSIDAPAAESFASEIYETFTRRNSGYRIISTGIFYKLLYMLKELFFSAGAASPPIRDSAHINRYYVLTVNFLLQNYMRRITSADIENELGINYNWANKIFKDYNGTTIMNYLNYIRISIAKELLLAGGRMTKDIAEATGFPDSHYFSRVFRKCERMTPSEYCRLHTPGNPGR